MESTKNKLDAILGITEDSSIDDFLNNISNDSDSVSNAVQDIDQKIKDSISTVDVGLKTISDKSTLPANLLDLSKINSVTDGIESSLNEVKDLIDVSKKLIMHVYQSVTCSDLVDPEIISSFAKLIESTRINIADYLELYKSRLAFYDKMRLSIFQQQQKIELLNIKHIHDMEKIKTSSQAENAIPENMHTFSQEEVVKMLDLEDKKNSKNYLSKDSKNS